MKKIVISGATSYIALAIIREMALRDIDVVAIIRPKSTRRKYVEQISPLYVGAKLTICENELGELMDANILKECVGADTFIHVGWSSDFENPRFNLNGQMKNVEFMVNAIELARKVGCERFLGLGSQAECGIQSNSITVFTQNNPITAYGRAKCEAYNYGKQLCERYGMIFLWVRILSVYGPWERQNTLIMSTIRSALMKKEVGFTRAEQIWDYLYVDDAARGIIAVVEKGTHGVKYPLGYGCGRVLKEYIEIIAKTIGNPSIVQGIGKIPYVESQPMYLVADISKLTADTDWKPKIDFEEGIFKTISWVINENER